MEDYEEYAKHARLITELYALSNNRFVQPMSMSQKPVVVVSVNKGFVSQIN